jgi:non-histone protein 10
MHKALAQAWRDLKADGQKPYFNEYEKNREKYLEKVNDLKSDAERATMSGNGGAGKRALRALSAASSIVPASNYDAPLSPAPGSTNDEQDEPPQQPGGGGGFTAVNR